MKLPILLDCDGVLSNWLLAAQQVAYEDFGIENPGNHWGWSKEIPGLDDRINFHIEHRGFCYNMEEYPDAIDWLRRIEAEFGVDNVFVCTAPWNEDWLSQRSHWLSERGVPIERQIQIKNKHLIQGHLIDDGNKNLLARTINGRTYPARQWDQGFCLARPWNSESDLHWRGDYEAAFRWLKQVTI